MSRSVKIGGYKLPSNILLAPLSGCSDLAFRLICREHGAKFCFFEMVDANSLVHNSRADDTILKTVPKDRPIAAQLVGGNAEVMLKAAKVLLKKVKVPFLDINAACPVKKMIQKHSGANLLRNTDELYRIVAALAENLAIPVTVKLRIGYEKADIKGIAAVARRCERSGAAALFVHGRTKTQLYAGEVNYEAIAAIKQAVKVPVFGSGNIFTPELARKMFEATGCDGITVARGAFGNPWIFEQIGQGPRPVTLTEKVKVLKRHLSYVQKYIVKHPGGAVGIMRKVALWYLKGFPDAAAVRGQVNQARSYDELLAIADGVAEQQ